VRTRRMVWRQTLQGKKAFRSIHVPSVSPSVPAGIPRTIHVRWAPHKPERFVPDIL